MQIGLLVGADEPVPQQRTDDRVDHDQPGADEQTHRHALRDARDGHGIAHEGVGAASDQMVGHLRRQRSPGAEVRNRPGRPHADDAGEGEHGEARDDQQDRELVGQVPPVLEGIDDHRQDDEEHAPEDDDLDRRAQQEAAAHACARGVEGEGSDEEPVGGDPSEQDERPGQEAAERGEDHEHGTETRLGGGGGVDDHAGGDEDGPARGDPHRPAEVERGQGRADDEQRDVDDGDEERIDAAQGRRLQSRAHADAQPPGGSGEGLEGEVHAAVEDPHPLLGPVRAGHMPAHTSAVPRKQTVVAPPTQTSSSSAEIETTPDRPSAVPCVRV